ncbi:hypothetical protein [Flavivirga eckloniae]|nr:hypothetical protein [Flavivirga eckloniae]
MSCKDSHVTEKTANKKLTTAAAVALIPLGALSKKGVENDMHPLSENINVFLQNQEKAESFTPTGLHRKDYLKIIDAQVRAMIKYQDKDGRIIDPVENVEKYYTTPCFAHSVAALVASSHIDVNDSLALRGMKALDISLTDMVNATVNGNHGDFYTWPVMLAYETYKPFVSKEQLKSWDDKIHSIQVEKLYRTYNKPKENNWVLVHTAGEFLRAKSGFTNYDYVEKMLGLQLSNFTDLGMYNEHGNPLPYDLFPRHYLSGMLQLEYKGPQATSLRHYLWKGAWTSLFMQSPFGELGTGYRSSHHIWNEAQQCVVFEIYANAYARAGREKEAGAFKRAAMMSLNSMNQWIREDGSGYIVKNRFPIENKHGYERYSIHTCYNMLATSMLAQAWEFSNNEIEELPSPADIGGFVLPIVNPFHKIFANAAGTYLEYDTNGDQKYNPTGIIRVHLKGGHPQLGPSDGIASYINKDKKSVALGPLWQNEEGTWVSLSEQKNKSSKVEILESNTKEAKFRITHDITNPGKKSSQVTIIETISITDGKVVVKNEFKGVVGNKRLTWPMLVYDGKDRVNVQLTESMASLELKGKGVQFNVETPKNVSLKRKQVELKHRNGICDVAYAEFSENTVIYSLTPKN